MSKHDEPAHTGSLTVSGVGEVHVKPDVAWVNLGVVTHARTAQEATAANATRMQAVIERMKQLGIAEKKLTTGGLSVYPVVQEAEGPDKGQITGYTVENHLTVRCAIEMAGQVFDEGIAAGASQSSQMSFGLQDDSQHGEEALALAAKSARRKAKVLAEAMDLRCGGPRSMEIGQSGGWVTLNRGLAKEAATPVLPGTLTISAQVTIVFDYLYE